MVYLLSRMKLESVKLLMKSLLRRPIVRFTDSYGNSQQMFESLFGEENACFAKGMGLILGVRTRRARFNIFCKPSPKLNLMIEISGPNYTKCSERITAHNPKKRMSTDLVTPSLIAGYLSRKKTTENIQKIPFFYEVMPNRIVVTYIPLEKGIHKLSIIWQGQHILDSPYTVKVEDCTNDQLINLPYTPTITSPAKFVPGLQWPASAIARNDTVSLDDKATVVARKAIKQTVFVNGRPIMVKDMTDNYKDIDERIDSSTSDNTNIDTILPKRILKQKKLQKLIINGSHGYNDCELSRITECDSFCKTTTEKSTEDSQQNAMKITDKTADQEGRGLTRAQEIDEENRRQSQLSSSQRNSSSSQHSKHSAFNMISNRTYIPVVPVRDMIQNWEAKLSKNANQLNDKNNSRNGNDSTFADRRESSVSLLDSKPIDIDITCEAKKSILQSQTTFEDKGMQSLTSYQLVIALFNLFLTLSLRVEFDRKP